MAIKRQTAHRVWISTITSGNYVKKEGWEPNYVEVNGKQISRVNLLGTIVSKFVSEDGNYAAITVDDGTDTIRCKAFGPDVLKIKDANIGFIARIIGKVKAYNEEIHLSPELIKETDPNWILAWRLELGKPTIKANLEGREIKPQPQTDAAEKKEEVSGTPQEDVKQTAEEAPEVIEIQDENFSAKVLKIIKNLNKGDGADINEVIKESKLDEEEAKNIIVGLLKSGDIFEPKKGKLKPLD